MASVSPKKRGKEWRTAKKLTNSRPPVDRPPALLMMTITIADHWDTFGNFTADSDPEEEFWRWKHFTEDHPDQGWTGDEFTLSDFMEYVEGLK